MTEALRTTVRKALVVFLALLGGWILFKIVVGAVTALAWTLAVIAAIVAVIYVLFFW